MFTEMLAHADGSNIVIAAHIAYAVAPCTLHDNRYAGFVASFDDIVDTVFIINAASEYDSAVKVMKIGEIEDVHLTFFIGCCIYICRLTEKEKNICVFFFE